MNRETSVTSDVRFRELDASAAGLRELVRFYDALYVAEFPDPDERESLANMKRYLRLKAQGWYGPNNYHIVLAELAGRPVGGCILDYLAEPNAGVLEFLFIGAPWRARGLGRALLEHVTGLLEDDALARRGAPLVAVVAEMNDPFRPAATPDNMDPFERCALWGRWGYYKIHFPYVQPALSRTQQPVECLALIGKPRDHAVAAAGLDAAWVLGVVGQYMRWAMRIRDPERNRQYREMARFVAAHQRVPLIPLLSYVGRDPGSGLQLREIDETDGAFDATIALLHEAIPVPGRVASPQQFREALARGRGAKMKYHLWALAGACGRLEGMASFFTMRPAGFGGYVVLSGSLRGRGLLRPLIARIEERMVRDVAGAQGWFVECADDTRARLVRVGFHEIGVDYRPPAVGEGGAVAREERLHLLFKPFGLPIEAPTPARGFVLDAVAAILRHVYGVARPRAHRCYRRVARTLAVA